MCYNKHKMNRYPESHEDDVPVNDGYAKWSELAENVESRGGAPERNTRKRIREAVETLNGREFERSGEVLVRPRTEIICDRDHIEGQRIDVIDKRDLGVFEFNFKLREPTEKISAIIKQLENTEDAEIATESGAVLRRGQIVYERAGIPDTYRLCDAFVLDRGDAKVFIANPESRDENNYAVKGINEGDRIIRAALGLIKVELPAETSLEDPSEILEDILENDLGIADALEETNEESEREYKLARYAWQHILSGEMSEEEEKAAERLERKEVFPGYTTLIEEGKHKEYIEKYGDDLRAIHMLRTGDARSIYRVLTQGLMSTSERFTRGVLRTGLSSDTDLDTGGGDNVFTRILTGEQRKEQYGSMVIFKPELFDRTDWYSYLSDAYGSTEDDFFSKRLSPDEMFERAIDPRCNSDDNEQMFRTGIGADYVESILVADDYMRDLVIEDLKNMGMTEFDGRAIEEVIAVNEGLAEVPIADFNEDFDEVSVADIDWSGSLLDWTSKLLGKGNYAN